MGCSWRCEKTNDELEWEKSADRAESRFRITAFAARRWWVFLAHLALNFYRNSRCVGDG